METAVIHPPPPGLAGLAWRYMSQSDLPALVELAGQCLLADGGLPFRFTPDLLQDLYFPGGPGIDIGAFEPDGRLAASGAVRISGDSGAQKAAITGLVRPGWRSRGIGAYLMRWSQDQALALLADGTGPRRVLQISTESLTEPAHRLFLTHGFEQTFESPAMQRDLRLPVPDHPVPQGVTFTNWQPHLAEQFFQAYHAAFSERPGFPGWSAAEWTAQVTENDHMPEWSFLALFGAAPVGFVIGNIDLTSEPPGGFIWQVGVVPAWRRRGLGSALMVESMRRMQAAGAVAAQLTVHADNPGAIQAYVQLGFTIIGRRARYERHFA